MAQPVDLKNFTDAGIEEKYAKTYAEAFANEGINMGNMSLLDKESLEEMGVEKLGHKLAILQMCKEWNAKPVVVPQYDKVMPARAPQLSADMTSQQYRKFKIDWQVYTNLTNLPDHKQHVQLYNNSEESVQTAIINVYPDFFQLDVSELLDKLELVVTKRCNPMVHRINFAKIAQSPDESIQSYIIRLKSASKDCNFSCPSCKCDISSVYIKDQFLFGVNNPVLQTDLLAKAETLSNVDDILKHAEAWEAAVRDQGNLNSETIAAARMSTYRKAKKGEKTQNRNPRSKAIPKNSCKGCGRFHVKPGKREEVCPAWGKSCFRCGLENHFSQVCNNPKDTAYNFNTGSDESYMEDSRDAEMSALIAHVSFDSEGKLLNNYDKDVVEIVAEVVPFTPKEKNFSKYTNLYQNFSKKKINIFPDSGASICLGGTKHLYKLGISKNHLIPCNKTVTAVGNHKMTCLGWIPMEFCVNNNVTKQALYICERIERLYFSKAACKEVGILPKCFPMASSESHVSSCESTEIGCSTADQSNVERTSHSNCLESAGMQVAKLPVLPDDSKGHIYQNEYKVESLEKTAALPHRPDKIPFPATAENIPKLKEWLLNAFQDTAFCKINKEGEFPTLSGPKAHIHLKDGAVPRARHSPIPVPFHMKNAVKKALDDDVKRGVLKPVAIGTPTEWCSTMVITAKKDGRPRRTIDYQYLNDQCLRETHHQGSPFHLAMQVPAGSYKTVLDAVDGYHSVSLDSESQPITTFITEWGRYMYARMPQGFLASGDAYTSRYDQVIVGVPRKIKIVDDVLLYDSGIEEAFYHTFDFLTLGFLNGIVFNIPKFTFCQYEVEFAGLRITKDGVAPSKSMLAAIEGFPTPANLTDARSWFGLVNQVAWAYSVSPIMQPFRDLLKSKAEFAWNQTLQNAFIESKMLLVQLVEKGVSTFDINRVTCLAPDWSKHGMGFLLLQKYCSCLMTKAPICCPDGWRLVFAGSRYCNDAESRYAPIEGEASAIAWALNKCRMFVMGCPNLVVVTDHAPLLGIFGDRDLSKISNPRLFKLKERTMMYRFSIQHCPGKWHRGSDALSRNVPAAAASIFEVCAVNPSATEEETISEVESLVALASAESMAKYSDEVGVISLDMVKAAGKEDQNYTLLTQQIAEGFPKTKRLTDPSIREYWEVRHRLSTSDGLAMIGRRIVIPVKLRKRVLRCLHAAHQGVVGMRSRANETVYWPGMDACIRNHRDTCGTCSRIAPSQPREPLVLSETPEWPFQKIVMDLFVVEHHTYLAIADRFSGWLTLYHLPPGKATATNLVDICRNMFQTYGIPEEISRDGGPPMQSQKFIEFLKSWRVKERISSVGYAQSNGRAELAVKAGKRIIYDNVASNGSLDTDKVARAVLQYRNTPIQNIGLSPAQMLLHRQLRDCLPAHPILYKPHKEWVRAGHQREQLLAQRNRKLISEYNSKAHTLTPLGVGDLVIVQNLVTKKWDRIGYVVERLPNRQYNIRMQGSGRVSLRNRRFLKKTQAANSHQEMLVSPRIGPVTTPGNFNHPTPTEMPAQQVPSPNRLFSNSPNVNNSSPVAVSKNQFQNNKTPRALARLQNFNKPGSKELLPCTNERFRNRNTVNSKGEGEI